MLTRYTCDVVLGNVDDSPEGEWRALYMFVHRPLWRRAIQPTSFDDKSKMSSGSEGRVGSKVGYSMGACEPTHFK
jgi:hypothetical protein